VCNDLRKNEQCAGNNKPGADRALDEYRHIPPRYYNEQRPKKELGGVPPAVYAALSNRVQVSAMGSK